MKLKKIKKLLIGVRLNYIIYCLHNAYALSCANKKPLVRNQIVTDSTYNGYAFD